MVSRDATEYEPLDINIGRGGVKKLMDDRLGRNNLSRGEAVESYTIGAQHKVGIFVHVPKRSDGEGSTNHKEID